MKYLDKKKWLASTLGKVKEVWEAKKHRKTEDNSTASVPDVSSSLHLIPEPTPDVDVDPVVGILSLVPINTQSGIPHH